MPLMLEIERAEGVYIFDSSGKKYIDFNSGIAVSALGHCHPAVVEAVQKQASAFMHTMVYGEHIQQPQVKLASLLTGQLPGSLDSVYFVNSGSEAVEGAMKLAKRATGRYEIIASKNAYHGSTQGSESLRSDRSLTSAFRPLLPGIRHIKFNQPETLDLITEKTACVIIEPVQAEAGMIPPEPGFLPLVQKQCNKVGALLVLDEIQTGYGRTGKLFAFQRYGIIPDILLTAKAMGGGMPIGAFIASRQLMQLFTHKPALGHITTFGGHPVSCAAGLACLQTLMDSDLIDQVEYKEKMIREMLSHPLVKEIRSAGLMMGIELVKKRYLKYVIAKAIELGVLVDWFLFNQKSFRVAPPLIIGEHEIEEACTKLKEAFDFAMAQ
jgi:acetylornithine/succinyldiaminopimelate/putrescine aminotransferase